jgi:hypothetical protein
LVSFATTLCVKNAKGVKMEKVLIVIIVLFMGNSAFADIYSAAKNGDLSALKSEINNGVDINELSKNGRSALHIAVANYKYSLVKFLVESGADIHKKDSSGNDALMIAVNKFPAVADDLIKWGANPYVTNNNGKTALEILKTVRSRQIPSTAYREKKIEQFKLAVKKYAKKYKEQNNNSQTSNSIKSRSKSCSKKEVLTMLNAGYDKGEIDDICADKSYSATPKNNKHVKTEIARVLRESAGFTREFLNTIKLTYSNSIVVFYDNCPKLMKRNDKRLSEEYAKKEKERERKKQIDKQKGVIDMSWGSFSAGLHDNPFKSSFKFKDKCYAMLNRAAKLAKTIDGVKEVEILK